MAGGLPYVAPRAAKNSGIRQSMAVLKYHSAELDNLKAQVNELLQNIESRASPSSKKKRAVAELRWELLLEAYDPDALASHRTWHEETVMKNYKFMLPILVLTCKGSKGRRFIKGPTLHEMMQLFTWAIARNTRNDAGEAVGPMMLAKKAMLSEFEDQVITLITRFNLDRYNDEKSYYGEHELKLITQEALFNTQKSGRLQAIQRICLMDTTFFTLCRPGSLGPSNAEYKAQGKYPRLSDIKLFRLAESTYRTELTLRHFKGNNNTAAGEVRRFIFEPTKNWENVLFDISIYFVVLLLGRGALEGITTLDQLRSHKAYSIPIRDDMLQEPLFLAINGGGHGFRSPPDPIGANSISMMCSKLCMNAGLAASSVYAFRRNGAKHYSIAMGKELAEMMLVHAAPGALHFYSDNTANVDPVATMMNELPVPHNQNVMHLLHKNIFNSRAVQVAHLFLKRGKKDDENDATASTVAPRNQQTAMVSLTEEEKLSAVRAVPEALELLASQERAWDAFLSCYSEPTNRLPYARGLASLNSMTKNKTVKLLVSPEEATEKTSALRAAVEVYQKKQKEILRTAKVAKSREENEKRKVSLEGTAEELEMAVEELKKPSIFLTGTIAPPPPRLLAQPPVAGPSRLPALSPTTPTPFSTEPPVAGPSGLPALSPAVAVPPELELEGVDFDVVHEIANKIGNKIQQEGASDDDDARLVDEQVTKLHTNLSNMMPKATLAQRPERSLPPPQNIADVEDPVPEDAPVTAAEVRDSFMEMLMAPIVMQNALANLPRETNGSWRCPRCIQYFHHDLKAQAFEFKIRSSLERHITVMHTPWKELVLAMIVDTEDEEERFQCPTPSCTFRGPDQNDIYKHCLTEDCPGHKIYHSLLDDHQAQVSDITDAKKSRINVRAAVDPAEPALGNIETAILADAKNALSAYADKQWYGRWEQEVQEVVRCMSSGITTEATLDESIEDMLSKIFDEYL
ncbi:hypothetical protein GALMADRAFT_217850 [Galerina marginata CBS 339.88]|uniref:Uncharacterized protein n=1 Tax=Galerina marginata (strain CBS 339.88) TaxID=685588 RepID=A0A067U0C4_GALM3|nr:hypothetical protein GALMADRAFT_217850 [Galerina marginata CBS 339.88]